MIPAPLSKVINVVSKVLAKDPVNDREEIIAAINGSLEMLYRHPATLELYFQVQNCATADYFNENCRNVQPTRFLGVVMPPQVKNVRELMTDGWAYQITERRVEGMCAPTFIPRRGTQERPQAEHLRPRLLERDILCGSRMVTFHSNSPEDCGKVIGLTYYDLNNNEQRVDVVLGNSPVGPDTSVGEITEIVFPERNGWITVNTAEGQILGRYHPSILIPIHEWFRLDAGCPRMNVTYRAVREPLPLVFDTDMVPFSDTYLWKLAVTAFQNATSMELNAGQANSLNRIMAQLSAASQADLANTNSNFNALLLSNTGRAALSTGMMFSRRTRGMRP